MVDLPCSFFKSSKTLIPFFPTRQIRIGLDQLRNRLRNQFTSAYEITTNAVLESINSTVPHNWGSPARLPNIPSVEGLNADAQKIMQDAYDVELKMWEQTVLLRSIQIQAYLAGQYEKTIHVDAFELMKNDIAGRTYQGREEFAAAYAGVYSEYMIPAQCCKFSQDRSSASETTLN